jgi:chromate transporter
MNGVSDWLALFAHFAELSLLGVGGAMTTSPEMQRYLVNERHWLSQEQFTSSIVLAQAAPGPNILFVALMGWQVGLNAGGGLAAGPRAWTLALLGLLLAMLGCLLPSCTLNYLATRWAHRNRELLAVRAFKAGMAPIVIGLLMAIGWLLSAAHDQPAQDWPLWLLTACVTLLVWKTRLHLLWLMAAGGLLGAFGLV